MMSVSGGSVCTDNKRRVEEMMVFQLFGAVSCFNYLVQSHASSIYELRLRLAFLDSSLLYGPYITDPTLTTQEVSRGSEDNDASTHKCSQMTVEPHERPWTTH